MACRASKMDFVAYARRVAGVATVTVAEASGTTAPGEVRCPVCWRYLAVSPKQPTIVPKHKHPSEFE